MRQANVCAGDRLRYCRSSRRRAEERSVFRHLAAMRLSTECAALFRPTSSEAPMSEINLRHGIFLPPFHPNEENPTQCLERDLELIEWLDRLGFHEAWIGEHHSAGYEIISSPDIFIAFAAERTRHISLGTGVVSLPYHHPMMIADRIVQLDHMTRGRIMFGAGPGLLAGD